MTQRNQATAVGAGHVEQPADQPVEQTEVRPTSRSARLPSELELKLARARVVIAHMAPDDPRARLLQVAVLRRDEILLEALLHRLGSIP